MKQATRSQICLRFYRNHLTFLLRMICEFVAAESVDSELVRIEKLLKIRVILFKDSIANILCKQQGWISRNSRDSLFLP
jgi:hypothetical protein